MDKGIFYLVCSVIIVGVVIASSVLTTKNIEKQCVGKTMVQKVVVMETPTPTATPAATIKPAVRFGTPTGGAK